MCTSMSVQERLKDSFEAPLAHGGILAAANFILKDLRSKNILDALLKGESLHADVQAAPPAGPPSVKQPVASSSRTAGVNGTTACGTTLAEAMVAVADASSTSKDQCSATTAGPMKHHKMHLTGNHLLLLQLLLIELAASAQTQ